MELICHNCENEFFSRKFKRFCSSLCRADFFRRELITRKKEVVGKLAKMELAQIALREFSPELKVKHLIGTGTERITIENKMPDRVPAGEFISIIPSREEKNEKKELPRNHLPLFRVFQAKLRTRYI